MEGSSEKEKKVKQGPQKDQKKVDFVQGRNKKRRKKGGCGCGKKYK
jgi:hypothetical protein